MSIKLKGMTWSHPRGYDPMVACSQRYAGETGIEVEWDKRSLQDFESYPVEDLAKSYDLIVIDHPHVGQITAENCLAPLDIAGREDEFRALASASVGPSFRSYNWDGHQWGFPIDAATQVQVYRSDLLKGPVATWAELMDLARGGQVLLALKPPHTLMNFFTLSAHLGTPCATSGPGALIDVEAGALVFERIADLVQLLDPACFDMDPIAIFERMAAEECPIACSPYIYGYVSYALEVFRPHRLKFSDIPVIGERAPAGSALGGTGIAVSAYSANRQAAVDFAYWVASGEVQTSTYASAGGQVGHGHAWADDTLNERTGDFYAATRRTIEASWVRPRHDGYMAFQQLASDRINSGLATGENGRSVVKDLNQLFAESFSAKAPKVQR